MVVLAGGTDVSLALPESFAREYPVRIDVDIEAWRLNDQLRGEGCGLRFMDPLIK